MTHTRTTVFVGISGGVDSATTAALLKRDGYEVVGVFIKTWQPSFVTCTWRDERRDAMRVCATLDIPFLTCDLTETYRQEVAEYMIDAYKRGQTPNPDVMCNQTVKFGAFLTWARKVGADYIATGHYARIDAHAAGYELHRGVDPAKDQTYFLWPLSQDVLSHTLFPLGGLYKKRVRKLAHTYQLPTAHKKDSQGVCFLGPIDMKTFLAQYIPDRPGVVYAPDGMAIGHHDGAHLYTLGERHNFTITQKGVADGPWYVVAKDISTNTITVSTTPTTYPSFQRKKVTLRQCNWIGVLPKQGDTYHGQLRHRGTAYEMHVDEVSSDEATVVFADPVGPCAPGQSLVLYEGTRCIGGGIIV